MGMAGWMDECTIEQRADFSLPIYWFKCTIADLSMYIFYK